MDALAGRLSATASPPSKAEFLAQAASEREKCVAAGMDARRERLAKDGPVRQFDQSELDKFATYDCGPPTT